MPPKSNNVAGESAVTLRGALIAGIAAVVAAVIGLGSALITGNYEDDRARSNLIREQRQAAYADFLAAAQTVEDLVALNHADPTQEQVESVMAAVNALQGQMQKVELLGSSPTRIMANALFIHERAYAAYQIYAPFCTNNPDVNATACVYIASTGGAAPVPEDAFHAAWNDFIREARKDLQVEDWGE